MTGIVLGVVMAVVSSAVSPAPGAAETAITSAAPAISRTGTARPGLKLPRDLVAAQSWPVWRIESTHEAQAPAVTRPSRAARIIGTVIGGAGGYWAGGMLGYAATQKSTDDDGVSGLRGMLIGAPIGAAVGALIGYQLAK